MYEKTLTGIVIDAGHGGADPGASKNGLIEKNLTLQISNYMYERFKELGIPVEMTRDDDCTLSFSDRLKKIRGFSGVDKDVIVISNHISFNAEDGAEVIYALKNSSLFSELIVKEIKKEVQNIKKAHQQRLPNNPTKDYYYLQRESINNETVTIVYGFLNSKNDDDETDSKWEKYAEAVVRATAIYKGFEYRHPGYIPEIIHEEIDEIKKHIVCEGDNLYSIANKYDISTDLIKEANNLTTNAIKIGQTLTIPKK